VLSSGFRAKQRQHRVDVGVLAEVAADLRIADQGTQYFQIMTMDDAAHADAGVGVDLQGRRGVQCALVRMVSEVGHPHVEPVGQEIEERTARIELVDALFHVHPHPLAGYVGDEAVQITLIREVLEETAFGDAGAPRDDVQAAAREAVRAELRLGGFNHRRAPRRVDASPRHRRHQAPSVWMTTGHSTVSHVTSQGVVDKNSDSIPSPRTGHLTPPES
jgi:hypothetical protein